ASATFWEAQRHRRDGSRLEVRVSRSPLYDANGEVNGCIDFVSDITEHKRLEQQLHQSQKMEAIGRLAGGVAHDFNNLLCVILGYSELLLWSLPPGSEPHGLAGEIRKHGDRAANLTRQLMA